MASSGLRVAKATAAIPGCPRLSTSAAFAAGSQGRREPRIGLRGDAAFQANKKGPGYRSSFSGHVATVFGSTGCVGRSVCNRLGKNGTQMIIPYHGDHYEVMRLKVCGDLGQVLFTPYNLKDEDSIRRSLTHSDVAINLIGKPFPTRNFSFEDVNVEGPARLARIAREMGAERFFHISHVNAKENPESCFLPKGSEWLKTKWLGEQRVKEEFPDATIIRATDIYGMDDNFLTYFMTVGRRGLNHTMPLWAKGEKTVKAPVWFGDVGAAIVNAIDMPQSKGVTYEAYGPERYLMSELLDWMHFVARRDPEFYNYRRVDLRLAPTTFLKAFIIGNLPVGTKWMGNANLDLLDRDGLSDDIAGLPDLTALGVTPHSIVEKMPFELLPYKSFGYAYVESLTEPPVPDPVPLTRIEIKAIEDKNASSRSIKQLLGMASVN